MQSSKYEKSFKLNTEIKLNSGLFTEFIKLLEKRLPGDNISKKITAVDEEGIEIQLSIRDGYSAYNIGDIKSIVYRFGYPLSLNNKSITYYNLSSQVSINISAEDGRDDQENNYKDWWRSSCTEVELFIYKYDLGKKIKVKNYLPKILKTLFTTFYIFIKNAFPKIIIGIFIAYLIYLFGLN